MSHDLHPVAQMIIDDVFTREDLDRLADIKRRWDELDAGHSPKDGELVDSSENPIER